MVHLTEENHAACMEESTVVWMIQLSSQVVGGSRQHPGMVTLQAYDSPKALQLMMCNLRQHVLGLFDEAHDAPAAAQHVTDVHMCPHQKAQRGSKATHTPSKLHSHSDAALAWPCHSSPHWCALH